MRYFFAGTKIGLIFCAGSLSTFLTWSTSQGQVTTGNSLARAAAKVPSAPISESEKKIREEVEKKVQQLAERTQKLKTAKDYSEFLDSCKEIESLPLTERHQKYLTSVSAWATGRRGELRLETAEQLKSAGTSQSRQAFESALADLNVAVEADANRWKSFLARGIAQVRLGNLKEGLADFNRVVELKPDNAAGWFNRAETNNRLGELEQALTDYNTTLSFQPKDLEALNGRGHILMKLGQFQAAEADFTKIQQRLPENRAALINLSDLYQKTQRWEKANAMLDKALQLESAGSSRVIALQRMAWLKATCPLQEFRQIDVAEQLIREAMQAGGESPVHLDTLAAILAAKGDFNSAREAVVRAIDLIENESTQSASNDLKIRLTQYEEGIPFEQGSDK